LLFTVFPVNPASVRQGQDARRHEKKTYPGGNASLTIGVSWGDDNKGEAFTGALSMDLRTEFHLAQQERGWAFGAYAELGKMGMERDHGWIYGGGLQVLSPSFWFMDAAWSIGVYGHEFDCGNSFGLTTGLSIGIRPRFWKWDFLLAVRADYRTSIDGSENIVTIGLQADLVVALVYMLGSSALSGTGIW